MAHVQSDLNGVVAPHVGPIVDKLELLLLLDQRAVTHITEEEAAQAPEKEVRHPGGKIVVEVQTGDARIFRRARTHPVEVFKHPITKEPEAKVGKPSGSQVVVEAGSNALVADVGLAYGKAQFRTTGLESKGPRRGLAVLSVAVPAKDVQLRAPILV